MPDVDGVGRTPTAGTGPGGDPAASPADVLVGPAAPTASPADVVVGPTVPAASPAAVVVGPADPAVGSADPAGRPGEPGADGGGLAGCLEGLRAQLVELADATAEASLSPGEAAALLAGVERAGRGIERLQVAAAHAADRARVIDVGRPPGNPEARSRYKDTADFMRRELHIGLAEAKRRLDAGCRLLGRTTLTGEVLPPVHERLAGSFARGEVGLGAAMAAAEGLEKAAPVAAQRPDGPAVLEAMEEQLTGVAEAGDRDTLRACVERWHAYLDQDGPEPTEAVRHVMQGLTYKGRRFGLHQYLLVVDEAQHEALQTLTNAATNPKSDWATRNPQAPTGKAPGETAGSGPDDPPPAGAVATEPTPAGAVATGPVPAGAPASGEGSATEQAACPGTPAPFGAAPTEGPGASGAESAGEPTATDQGVDRATPALFGAGPPGASDPPVAGAGTAAGRGTGPTKAQVRLDALVHAVRLSLASGAVPDTGGMRPQVMVTIDYNTLRGELAPGTTGLAESMYQGPVNPRTIRRLACNAGIIPVVLGGAGELLNVGRSQRLFTEKQQRMLYARDRGCTGPGCMVPASMTEAHHLDPWSQGGETDVQRGCLCCPWHHHLAEEGDWEIRMISGRPHWIPPAYIDPTRTPLLNTYFHTDTSTPAP